MAWIRFDISFFYLFTFLIQHVAIKNKQSDQTFQVIVSVKNGVFQKYVCYFLYGHETLFLEI